MAALLYRAAIISQQSVFFDDFKWFGMNDF